MISTNFQLSSMSENWGVIKTVILIFYICILFKQHFAQQIIIYAIKWKTSSQ